MRIAPWLCALLLAGLASAATAQTLPALKFNPKIRGFMGGSGDPASWTAENAYPGATLLIYGFRPFSGDFAGQFRYNLLREFAKDLQNARLPAPPQFEPIQIAGADAALAARFIDNVFAGRHHLRIAILSKGAVAIIDYSAQDPGSFQRHFGGVGEMLKTLAVGTPQPAKPPTAQQAAAAKSLAGLYIGSAMRFVPSPVLGASVGSGSWQASTRFYLLSPDGKVYRGYGVPKAPGGDISRFDFDSAKAQDPGNSGTYAVEGSRVVLRFGSGAPEEQVSRAPASGGPLEINGTVYKREIVK